MVASGQSRTLEFEPRNRGLPRLRRHGRACPGHLPWRQSSALTLGGLEMVSSDGVGDDEDFPHDGGEGDLSRSIVVADDAIVEVAHLAGVTDGGSGGVEEGASHERPSMTGFCATA